MRTEKGFTLIELLVVVAIIGLISTIAGVGISAGRAKARDNKRVADLKQIQKGLELAFGQGAGYPVQATAINLGTDAYDVLCGKGMANDFVADTGAANCDAGRVYLGLIPRYPTPPAGEYEYIGTPDTYCIEATLEKDLPALVLNAGPVRADQTSFKNGACP